MAHREIVRRVIDGDTFETEGGRPPIRLLHVQSPGMHEFPGLDVRRHLVDLLAGGRVIVTVVSEDPDGRRLAWVDCNGISVNRAMHEYLEGLGLAPSAGWVKHQIGAERAV